MIKYIKIVPHSLFSKLFLPVGLALIFSLSIWAYFNTQQYKNKMTEDMIISADRLAQTILLGIHYSMMHNLKNDINTIIKKIDAQNNLENISIYNKNGQIKFSNKTIESSQTLNTNDPICYVCHKSQTPLFQLNISEKTRIFYSPNGYRLLGLVNPIYNQTGCASKGCHVQHNEKKVIGILDLIVSLEKTDDELLAFKKRLMVQAILTFILISVLIFLVFLRFVKRPLRKMIEGTLRISAGQYHSKINVIQDDELGLLSDTINKMGGKIGEKQGELNKQKDEYQHLFELVPCIITVQDKNYKLVGYNREFEQKFKPKLGDYCYFAYKGRNKQCEICPVHMTFQDGQSHFSEERGVDKNGNPTFWIVKTSPVKNSDGEVVAAMEMSLDVTNIKILEEELEKSEKKYHAIFNNIPNPIFVMDSETLEILDCNKSVEVVYGYSCDEIIGKSFLFMFKDNEKQVYSEKIKNTSIINRAKHINKSGHTLFVDIRISPFNYPGREVWLVTTSDITKQLETEQQLIQASKMATLGEMATGIAHEINQPLTVIKTASNFFMRKINRKEPITDEIFLTMSNEIDAQVDRASKIINHMRQFGRKSDRKLVQVNINETLKKAVNILGQQLKVMGIDLVWELEENLPFVSADPNRLEQVFINLLINARDSIDDKWQSRMQPGKGKTITLKTCLNNKKIVVEISDTGSGIPKEHIDRIFEPFFTTKKVGQGTGLGLSISYGIIQECNGDIKVVSDKDQGAKFIMTFSIADEA
jgi:histidine kinase